MKPLSGILLIFMLLTACAGQLPRAELLLDVPEVLSEEMQNRFKVESQPAPAPVVVKPKVKSKEKGKPKAVGTKAEVKKMPPVFPFKVQEKLNYKIKAMGFKAGDLQLQVMADNYQLDQHPVWYFKGTVLSSPFFTNFYKLNLAVESFADRESLRSYRYQIFGDEGKKYKRNLEFLDYAGKRIILYKQEEAASVKQIKEENLGLDGPAYDFLTLLYFLRAQALVPGTMMVPTVQNGKYQNLPITVEAITYEYQNRPQPAWKLVFNFNTDKLRKNHLIILNNEQKLPVEIYAELKFATVILSLE